MPASVQQPPKANASRQAASNIDLSAYSQARNDSQEQLDGYDSIPLTHQQVGRPSARSNVGALPYDMAPRYPQSGDDYLSEVGERHDDEEETDDGKSASSPPPTMLLPPNEVRSTRYINTVDTGLGASAHFLTPDQGRFGRDRKNRTDDDGTTSSYGGRRSSAWSAPGSPRSQSPFGMRSDHERSTSSGYNTPAPGQASVHQHLVFADGDFIVSPPSNAFSRFFYSLFEKSFLVRWTVYLVPILILLWIPGLVGQYAFPEATVYNTPLVWWSSWTSVVWVSWFGAALAAKVLPVLLRNTIGLIFLPLKNSIIFMNNAQFFVGAATWSFIMFTSYTPFVVLHCTSLTSSCYTVLLFEAFLKAIFIILCLLLGEKLVIQFIAHDFHKKSFADRIQQQKFQVQTLVALYLHSRDIGRIDTSTGGEYEVKPAAKRTMTDPTLLAKRVLHGAKRVGKTTASMFGTVASEFAGERLVNLVPNSPESMVATALSSANKTKQLARRIYFSFTPSDRNMLFITDISPCFLDRQSAEKAFDMFDRDENGDVSLEEIELVCMDVFRERRALKASMRDIDSAVAKLDSILLSVWYLIALLIIVTALVPSSSTTLTGASTLVLSFSWLFATTAQEILGSFIFVFIKHAIDVSDRVDIDGESYTVKEMHLLSTVFQRVDGKIVQAPNNILNTKFIHNVRRSGPITEKFEWDVAFDTSFDQIEALRVRMLDFLEAERRDFSAKISIAVKDFPGQSKMSLSADISYRSNWQNGALKATRRNKWICELKIAMQECRMFGPSHVGNPSPPRPPPIYYSEVPYTPEVVAASPVSMSAEEVEEPRSRARWRDAAAVIDDPTTNIGR